MMVVTFVNSRLVKGVGAERMLQYGLMVLPCAGALLIYNAWSQTGGLWGIVIPVVLFVGHISLPWRWPSPPVGWARRFATGCSPASVPGRPDDPVGSG